MTILERLIYYFNHSAETDIYHNVIREILLNLTEASQATIYDLADLCHVSTTTISRMCKFFEYESFHTFKMELSESIGNFHFYNRYLAVETEQAPALGLSDLLLRYIDDVEASVRKLKETDFTKIERICDEINRVRKVFFYTIHIIPDNLINFQVNLAQGGKQTRVFIDQSHQMGSVAEVDDQTLAVFLIPLVRRANFLTTSFQAVRKSPARTLLIINTQSALAREADIALTFSGHNSIADNYSFNLYLDMISQAYRRKYVDVY